MLTKYFRCSAIQIVGSYTHPVEEKTHPEVPLPIVIDKKTKEVIDVERFTKKGLFGSLCGWAGEIPTFVAWAQARGNFGAYLLPNPIDAKPDHVLLITMEHSEPQYMPEKQALQHLTSFANEKRSSGDDLLRSGNETEAAKHHELVAFVSDKYEDYLRCYLLPENQHEFLERVLKTLRPKRDFKKDAEKLRKKILRT